MIFLCTALSVSKQIDQNHVIDFDQLLARIFYSERRLLIKLKLDAHVPKISNKISRPIPKRGTDKEHIITKDSLIFITMKRLK